ncbi:MAG: AAA family ATPase, partial [Sediminibacterium sp.]|uniref:AAA family ATPase n=1 Tax=Flavobacterium sp. TaxID=239 RepID=UPI0032641A0A
MDLLNKGGYNLRNLSKINIILGKNGCGKSTALKAVEVSLTGAAGCYVKYLSPERGGHLTNDPNLDHSLTVNGPQWSSEQLRKNQYQQFKQQSVFQYKKLENVILKEIEKIPDLRNNHNYTFDTLVEKINSLLTNIEIKRTDTDFEIFKKGTTDKISSEAISSGESELISLAIECLFFDKKSPAGQTNVLLIDEPDVHLHPDLQVRFAKFIKALTTAGNFTVILATHSTAFLGALSEYQDARFAFMQASQTDFDFKEIDDTYSRILPIFGAHPLSNLFNESPILLLEGEDDVRIWQQAIRTSINRLKLYPCSVDTIDNLNTYENEVASMLVSVYDDAKGYSLRDRDEDAGEINDMPPVTRFRLSCRNAENLILTDEVLINLNTTWQEMEQRL